MLGWVRRMLAPLAGPAGVLRGVKQSTVDPPKRGTKEHLEVFEVSPWPRAVGDKVATAVACVYFRLLTVRRGGQVIREPRLDKAPMDVRARLLTSLGPNVTEITEHIFLEALDNPNPFMDRMALLKITELHIDFVGDAFWLKQRNGLGAPTGFWPIPPHWVTDTPRPDKPSFTVSWRSWQQEIPASEIHWFHEASPANPYARGTGIGWSLGDEVQVDEYAAKMAAALFFNRARPDFVFATGLSREETERLELDWTNRLQGWWRAHRPYFLHGDSIDLQKSIREFQQPTMEQLVYPGLRKVQRDIILQVWGTPPEMFGIVENSNRATIEAAEYLFSKWVVAGKAERLRGGLQRLFVEEYDKRGVIHYDSPVTEDKEHRLNVAKAAPHALELDEWRQLMGAQPVGGDLGKARLVPMASYLTIDPLDPSTRPAGAGAAMRATDQPAATPLPKSVTRREEGLVVRVLDAVKGLLERPPQPVALTIHQGDVNVEGAKGQTLLSFSPEMKLLVPEGAVKSDVHVTPVVKAELPESIAVRLTEVPATKTTVTQRNDQGIQQTETRQE